MDGNRAFEYLQKMTDDERKAVRILWFDEEMLDSLPSVDGDCYNEKYTKKCEFFDSLSNEEKGELIERGLYAECGDYTQKHSDFLDDFAERFDNAIGEKMMTTQEGASALLGERFDEIVENVTSASEVFEEDDAELNENGDRCTENPNVRFSKENAQAGISFVVYKDERESEDKPWMWWFEGDTQEYHFFATLDEALDDLLKNMERLDTLK